MSYTVTLDDHPTPCDVVSIAHNDHPVVARFADYCSADHFLQVMHDIQPEWMMRVEGGKR